MIGRLIERLFVSVQADLSTLSSEMQKGVRSMRSGTTQMAKQWQVVERELAEYHRQLKLGTITHSQYMKQTNALVGDMRDVGMAYRDAQRQVFQYQAALNRTSRISMPQVFNKKPVTEFARSTGMARMQMLNLGYQLNDVGMTLATGMNPMTVLIQQGSQMLQIYAGQGGVKTALQDIGKILGGLGKRLWPLAVIAAGFKLLQMEINEVQGVTVTFGDTALAVFQVIGRGIMKHLSGPISWMKEAFASVVNFIKQWFPPVMNAVVGAVVAGVQIIGHVWDLLPDLFHDVWARIKNDSLDAVEAIVNFFIVTIPHNAKIGGNAMIQAMVAAFRAVAVVWEGLPGILRDAMAGAVNWVVQGAETMINAALEGIQKLLDGLNELLDFVGADKALEWFGFSGQIPELNKADLSKWKMTTEGAARDMMTEIGQVAGKTFNENFIDTAAPQGVDLSGQKSAERGSFGELGRRIKGTIDSAFAEDYAGKFFEAVKDQAVENALKRVAKGVEDIGGAAKSAAEEIKDMMEGLNEQLKTAADNLAGVFTNAFERLAETGKLTFSDFIKDMNSLIIKSTSAILQEELSNMFQQLAKSRGGLGGLFSNIFTGLFGGGLPGRALGGIEMPNRGFMAGENGPEWISQDGPSGARRVSTAGRTKSMMGQGGGGRPVVMNVYTQDAQSFQKSQGQIASRMNAMLTRGNRNR